MARKSPPYIGDRILAVYQALASCLCLGLLSLGSVASLLLSAKPSFVLQFEKNNPSEAWKYLNDPKNSVAIGIALAFLAFLVIGWIVGTWRGRPWALVLHLAFNAPSAVVGVIVGQAYSVVISILVAVYCVLRLTGTIGPSPTIRTAAPRRRPPSRKRKRSSAGSPRRRAARK
ncbi:MAG TPA: hypothetical protein VHE55_19135 [Fimbriimonadaceae bacterium]|nr:hypothetical protein [Fimbriimonadaceae bacterium]